MIKINSIPLNSLYFHSTDCVHVELNLFILFHLVLIKQIQTVLRFLSHIFLESPEQGCLFDVFPVKLRLHLRFQLNNTLKL
jgi:hypothetical protein